MERVARNRSDLETLEEVIRFVRSFDSWKRLMANGWMPTDQIQSLRLFIGSNISHFLGTLVLWKNLWWVGGCQVTIKLVSVTMHWIYGNPWNISVHSARFIVRNERCINSPRRFWLELSLGSESARLKQEGNCTEGFTDMITNNRPTAVAWPSQLPVGRWRASNSNRCEITYSSFARKKRCKDHGPQSSYLMDRT